MMALPQQLVSTDPKQLFSFVRQVVDFLRQLPRFEIKTVETTTESEIELKTSLAVKGVLLIQAYRKNSPDTTVTFPALVDWRLVSGGIKVRVDTAAILHSFTFLIIGV